MESSADITLAKLDDRYVKHGDIGALGFLRNLMHNRFLQKTLTEPSYVLDSACQSSDYELSLEKLYAMSSEKLEKKLWSGFSKVILPILELKVSDTSIKSKERSNCAWELARWYAFNNQNDKALKYVQMQREIDSAARGKKGQNLLETEILVRLNRGSEALEYIGSRLSKKPDEVDFKLAKSNALCAVNGDIKVRLELINSIFKASGLAGIKLRDFSKGLQITNLTCESVLPVTDGPKVSVIIPVFNASDQIRIALEGLLEQTYQNLEIIVANDCSTDNTAEIVDEYARSDSRVQLVSTEINSGAYPARNMALRESTGDLVTVHDGDDWSHSQKIELQVKALIGDPLLKATVTYWARTYESIYFSGTFRAHGTLISENTSSLLFKRELLVELEGWDNVRTSADTELQLRIQRLYGPDSIRKILKKVPLSFALDQPSSLTRTGPTHAKTMYYGPRREYRESAKFWHETVLKKSKSIVTDSSREKMFPIPQVLRGGKNRTKPEYYDVVIVADFNLSGGAYISTLNYIKSFIKLGHKVAVFHWRRCDLNVAAPLRSEIRALALNQQLDILTTGDQVNARLVLVGYPVVLNFELDAIPEINADQCLILVNQMPYRLLDHTDIQYCPVKVRHNATQAFNADATFAPISGYVQRLMKLDGRFGNFHQNIWNPLNAPDASYQAKASRVSDPSRLPVVGRHSRDHYTKWPSNKTELAQAYLANTDIPVKLLGGANHALECLQETPKNWTVLSFTDDISEFVSSLDFFIHFPHELYIEEFGRAALEAMACGIPVILPLIFKETFGNHALYCEARNVETLIKRVWNDPQEYAHWSRLSIDFAQRKCCYTSLTCRLDNLD